MNKFCKAAPIVTYAVLLLMSPGTSRAQDNTAPDTPVAPYVADVPDFFQWTITITNKSTDANQPGSPTSAQAGKPAPLAPYTIVKLVCTKTKEIKRDVVFFTNGNSSEFWHYKDYVITKAANGEITMETVDVNHVEFIVPDVSVDGFFGVDCVTIGNFLGKKKLENGQQAYLYSGVFTLPSLNSPTTTDENGKPIPQGRGATVPADAMIAADTRLPLVAHRDTRTFTYSYQPPPTEMLELPADIQKRLSAIEARQSFIEKMQSLERR